MKIFFQNKMFRKISLSTLAIAIVVGGFLVFSTPTKAAISTVTVTAPNGGEVWSDSHSITWTTNPASDPETVNLYYCTGGNCTSGTYTLIVSGISNTGNYYWDTASVADATTYKIRVGANSDPLLRNDSSDATFTIDNTHPTTTATITSLSADTGTSSSDFITQTAAQTISGTLSVGLAGGEILYGSVDGGSNWVNITSKVAGTAITWNGATLSGTSSIKMKVTDAAGNDGAIATQAYTVDNTAPVLSASGIVGTTNGASNDTVVMTFSENVSPTTTWPSAFTSITSNGQALAIASGFNLNGNVLTLTLTKSPTTPGTYLRNGNSVIVTPKVSEIRDTAGNYAAITPITSLSSITGDTTAPTVALTYAPNQTVYKAGTSVTITATFNEPIYETVLPTIAIATVGNGSVTATNMTKSTNTVYTYAWTVPAGSDDDGTATVTIVSADLAGNTNATATNNTKTIDNTVPTLTSANIVGTTVEGAGDTVVMTFSENVSPTTTWPSAFTSITSNGVTLNVAGASFSLNGNVLRMTLAENPADNTTYIRNGNTIIVTPKVSEIRDAGYNYVAITPITSAATISGDSNYPNVAISYSASSFYAGEVVTVTATFDEAMSEVALPKIAIETPGNGGLSATDMTRFSNTVYTYAWTVPSGTDEDGVATMTISVATDLAGNINATATNNAVTIDALPPVVNSFTATDVSYSSATLNVLTNKIATCRYATVDEAYDSMTEMYDTENTITHEQPLTGLSSSTRYDYYVRCRDNSGNTIVSSAHVSFVTTASDTLAPHVDAQTPVHGATGVSINVHPTVTFSEAMDANTVNSNTVQIRLVNDDSVVPATYSLNNARTIVTLTPTSPLYNEEVYYIWVSGAKDVAGNTITSYTTSASQDFTTVTAGAEPEVGLTITPKMTNVGETNGVWNEEDGSAGGAFEWVFDMTLPNKESLLSLQFSDWTNGLSTANNMRYWSEEIVPGGLGSATNPVIIRAKDTYPTNVEVIGDEAEWTGGQDGAGIQTKVHVQLQIPNSTPAGSHSASFKVRTTESNPV